MRWQKASKGYILKREYEAAFKRLLECACIFSSGQPQHELRKGLHTKKKTASEEANQNIALLAYSLTT